MLFAAALAEIDTIYLIRQLAKKKTKNLKACASLKRTSPSAGARYPIDLLISFNNYIYRRTLLYYNPVEHSLGELLISKVHLWKFFNEIDRNLCIDNSCVIWFAIQTTKTISKYDNSESLYWRDTGAYLDYKGV